MVADGYRVRAGVGSLSSPDPHGGRRPLGQGCAGLASGSTQSQLKKFGGKALEECSAGGRGGRLASLRTETFTFWALWAKIAHQFTLNMSEERMKLVMKMTTMEVTTDEVVACPTPAAPRPVCIP